MTTRFSFWGRQFDGVVCKGDLLVTPRAVTCASGMEGIPVSDLNHGIMVYRRPHTQSRTKATTKIPCTGSAVYSDYVGKPSMSSLTSLLLSKKKFHHRYHVAVTDPAVQPAGYALYSMVPQDDGTFHGTFQSRQPVNILFPQVQAWPGVVTVQVERVSG